VARTQSLYARLDDLEANFAARLLPEIAKEAKGHTSMFLLRRMTPYFSGKSYRSGRVQELEAVYNELLELKHKLRDPMRRGPLRVVRGYEHLVPHGKVPTRQTRIQFARAQLQQLGDDLKP
jgi:hypothetical protein